jgi:hypothetical protein
LALTLCEPATGFEVREQNLEQAMLCTTGQQTTSEFTEHRVVKAGIRRL